MKRWLLIASALITALMPVQTVFAADFFNDDPYDPQKIIYEYRNNVVFRENNNGTSTALCSGSAIPITTTKLDADTMGRINALKATYLQGAQRTGVRWEVIAAIDYREDNNNPNKSILGGEPLGQQAVDSQYAPKTKLESIDNGMTILKGKKSIYGVDPTKAMNFLQLQEAFVTYNRGSAYAAAGQAPETSPYVMNQYDDQHKNMVFPNIKGETLAGRRETGRYGAMTVYANLVAEGDANDADCIGAGVGAKVDYSNLYPKRNAGTLTDKELCAPRPSQPSFKLLVGPPCDSFIATDKDYKKNFGKEMGVLQGYRTAAQQIACGGDVRDGSRGSNPACARYDPKNDPPEHLWGTAIDFTGPVATNNTKEHTWLVNNGPKYGWFWPNWAKNGQGGTGVYEPWHFAYYFAGHNPATDNLEGLAR